MHTPWLVVDIKLSNTCSSTHLQYSTYTGTWHAKAPLLEIIAETWQAFFKGPGRRSALSAKNHSFQRRLGSERVLSEVCKQTETGACQRGREPCLGTGGFRTSESLMSSSVVSVLCPGAHACGVEASSQVPSETYCHAPFRKLLASLLSEHHTQAKWAE